MAHGSKPPALMRQLAEAGLIPESDVAPPVLGRGLAFIYQAFWQLGSDRHVEQGPIPFTAIDAFARRYRIRADGFDRFRTLIVRLDNAFRQRQANVIEKQMKQAREEGSSDRAKPL
jgi:hypothetical protein